MLNLGPEKLLVVFAVALLVLGPEELPRVARELGRFMSIIREIRGRFEGEVADLTASLTAPPATPSPPPTLEPEAPAPSGTDPPDAPAE